jgi:hypothetical protein
MAGFKRGGSRGGNSGGFKKSFTKKRLAEDEDDAPSASKKSRGNDEDSNIVLLDLAPDLFSSPAAAIDVLPLVTSKAPP